MENLNQQPQEVKQEPPRPEKAEEEFSVKWHLKTLAVIYVILGVFYILLRVFLK
jgi:hypothetical protein